MQIRGEVRVPHRRRVGALEPEREQPPGRQQQADPGRGPGAPERARPRDLHRGGVAAPEAEPAVADAPTGRQQLDHRQQRRAPQRVEPRHDVGEDAPGEHDGGPGAVPPLAHGGREQPQEQHGQGEAERERVLPRQGREQIAAVDRERVVEEERQGRRGQQRRDGGAEAEEAATGPRRDGQHHRPGDRAQLERDVVGDDPAADGDEEVGQREIEGVEGEPVVPARVPARDVPVADHRPQEVGHRDVRAGVPARRRGVGEEQAGVELRERDDDHGGDGDDRDGPGHPPPGRPPARAPRRRGRLAHLHRRILQAHHAGAGPFRCPQPSAIPRGQRGPAPRGRAATWGLTLSAGLPIQGSGQAAAPHRTRPFRRA